MAITPEQLSVMPFGYLCGADLMQFGATQLLTKQYLAFSSSLIEGCKMGYGKITSSLINRYDIKRELAKLAPVQGTAKAIIGAGSITSFALITLGGIYESAPDVAISAPGAGGIQATAHSTISGAGVLTGIVIDNAGTLYATVPTVTLSGGLAIDTRDPYTKQLTALLALQNIMGNMQNLSDYILGLMRQAEKDLLAIRNAQMNLELHPVPVTVNTDTGLPNPYPQSDAVLIPSSFNYLG